MLTPLFNYIRCYGPGMALAAGGLFVAHDYLPTGRLDLLLGGLALSALGVMIADVSGPNFISRHLLRGRFDIGNLMGLTGLFSVAALGGGEAAHLAAHYGLDPANPLQGEALTNIIQDPGIYKVAANFTVYTAVSLMDFPRVARWAQNHIAEKDYRLTQTALSFIGAVMIGHFGAEGRIFSARMFGKMNSFANLYSFAAKKHALPPARVPESN